MQVHASCVCREGAGVLLLGPSGCGKSDLVLRLLECGFVLVADDRVNITDGIASAPDALAGLLEVRGLGILKLSHVKQSRLVLAVDLAGDAVRLPEPSRHAGLNLPLVTIDPNSASATARVSRALDCALGRIELVAFEIDPAAANAIEAGAPPA
jgi:HPr kinase/phosphorylase